MLLVYMLLPVLGAVLGYHLGQKDLIFKNPVKGVHQRRIVRLGVLAVLFLALLIFTNYLSDQANPAYYESAKIFFAGLVIIGLIYAVINYEFSLNKNESDLKIKKSLASFDTINNWHKEPMVSHISEIKKFEKSKNYNLINGDIDEFMAFMHDDKNAPLLNSLVSILNYFETIVSGMNEGILDEQYIRRYYESIMLDYYQQYSTFITKKRSNERNQKIWIEFTRLAQEWNSPNKLNGN